MSFSWFFTKGTPPHAQTPQPPQAPAASQQGQPTKDGEDQISGFALRTVGQEFLLPQPLAINRNWDMRPQGGMSLENQKLLLSFSY